MKLLYQIIGIIALMTGFVGAFVPLLPTTCFILLAAWCFSKSSPKLYASLKKNSFIGDVINNWEQHHYMPLYAQRIAIGSMLLSGLLCLLIIDSTLAKFIALALICCGIWFVYHIPTKKA